MGVAVLKARLVKSHDIAPEVKHFVFEVPEVEQLPYLPGQFVSFSRDFGDKKVTRAYSTASAPQANRFELCLNRVHDGLFSPFLFDLEPGATLDMKGPLEAGGGRAITLIYGVRYEESLLYRAEFERLQERHSNFTFLPTLTRPDESWRGLTGRVQAHTLELLGERRDMDVYICGLKAMVDDLRGQLKELNFDRRRIIFEKYD
jgi:ferredoxin-NADP reductase